MRTKPFLALLGAAALFSSFAGAVSAQPPPPSMHGRQTMGGLHGRMGGMRPGMGQIVANKNTRVYHLPGDHGNMPSAKNTVYFRSEREAIAAGYHKAGMRRTTPMRGMPRTIIHPMSGSHMNGHLPK